MIACRTNISGGISLSPLRYDQRAKDNIIDRPQLHHFLTCHIQAPSSNHGAVAAGKSEPIPIFDQVGVDYAAPIMIKSGSIRKPTITKSYVVDFVRFVVKAVHLETMTSLTTAAFIATLCCFITRRGKPSVIWSNHRTNFVGAARELKQLMKNPETWKVISDYCSHQGTQWNFIPEQSPHFGRLWEAVVKSFKFHLKQITGHVKVNFEELTMITTQIEACLNSWSLTPILENTDETEALTPDHFIIGRPLEVLPDPSSSHRPMPELKRWHFCQMLVRHYWQRCFSEYLGQLQRLSK